MRTDIRRFSAGGPRSLRSMAKAMTARADVSPKVKHVAFTTAWVTDHPENSISWDAFPDAETYDVYFDVGSGWTLLATGVGGTSGSDVIRAPGSRIQYRVDAIAAAVVIASGKSAVGYTYGPPDVSFTPSAEPTWSTTPQGPAMSITATITSMGTQPVATINFYEDRGLGFTYVASTASTGVGAYSQSLTVGGSSDQGQPLGYKFGFVNDAGETLSDASSATWASYGPQYFAQGYSTVRQANPYGGVYPWLDNVGSIIPDGLQDYPISSVVDWSVGTQIAIARPSYPPVIEANYDAGYPVAFLDFNDGTAQTNNLRFHDGNAPVTWNFGTGDFTMYFVFYYDAINGAALLCNYDSANTGDFSAAGVVGSVFFTDSANNTDTLWGLSVPDVATSGWRVLAVQRISGTYYAQISDGAGTGSSTDSVASAMGAQAYTGIGADDGGYSFGADLRVKAFGFADGAYNGEIPFLFDYLVSTFL